MRLAQASVHEHQLNLIQNYRENKMQLFKFTVAVLRNFMANSLIRKYIYYVFHVLGSGEVVKNKEDKVLSSWTLHSSWERQTISKSISQ